RLPSIAKELEMKAPAWGARNVNMRLAPSVTKSVGSAGIGKGLRLLAESQIRWRKAGVLWDACLKYSMACGASCASAEIKTTAGATITIATTSVVRSEAGLAPILDDNATRIRRKRIANTPAQVRATRN